MPDRDIPKRRFHSFTPPNPFATPESLNAEGILNDEQMQKMSQASTPGARLLKKDLLACLRILAEMSGDTTLGSCLNGDYIANVRKRLRGPFFRAVSTFEFDTDTSVKVLLESFVHGRASSLKGVFKTTLPTALYLCKELERIFPKAFMFVRMQKSGILQAGIVVNEKGEVFDALSPSMMSPTYLRIGSTNGLLHLYAGRL